MDKIEKLKELKSLFDSQVINLREFNQLKSEIIGNVSAEQFKTVRIGNQIWMSENLNVSHFRNGDVIPDVEGDDEWTDSGEKENPASCDYNNTPTFGKKYGKLYNWFAVNDSRGIAPEGWHIPNEEDWIIMITFLGGEKVAGIKMKNSQVWDDCGFGNQVKSGNGTNESGFAGIPGGQRFGQIDDGSCGSEGSEGYWWSTTEFDSNEACFLKLENNGNALRRGTTVKTDGMSIRCIRD